jgi:hypothetical protein
MPYTALNVTVPTVAQTRQAAVDAMRTNIAALRDSIVATGCAQGFNYSVAGGTAEQPAQLFYKRGAEWIRADLTWGATGGELGNVTKAAFYYSSNSGGAYDPMADASGYYVVTVAYDANANPTTSTWGSTP